MNVNAAAAAGKRKRADPTIVAGRKFKSKKKARRAAAYHSSDEDEEEEEKNDNLDFAAAKQLKIQEEAVRKQNRRVRTGPAGAANVDDETLLDDDQTHSAIDGALDSKDGNGGVQVTVSDSLQRDRENGTGLAQNNSKSPSFGDDSDEHSSTETSSSASESEQEPDGNTTDDRVQDGHLHTSRPKTKRNDPTALATSLNAILTSKPSTKVKDRADPILSRSKFAADLSQAREEAKLEARVKRKLKQDRRERLERGHVPDVITGGPSASQTQKAVDAGLTTPAPSKNVKDKESRKAGADEQILPEVESLGGDTAALVAERETRLRKTAQRGVVKLFNAVRAAQVAGLAAESEAKKKGVIGMGKRKDRVNEMSKEGFLGMLNGKVTDG